MSQSNANSTRRLASSLLLGTALAVWSSPALAQAEPPAGTIPGINDSGGAVINDDAAIAPADNAFNRRYEIDIDGDNRILTFDTYDVGADVLVDYINLGAAGQFTAVNNITGGNPSDIYGLIRSESNIDIWLINPDGITFGATGGFSGASLLVSTLSFDGSDADLLAELADPPPGVSATFERTNGNLQTDQLRRVFVQEGATLNSATGNMVLIGERITVNGTLTADDGSVVMVGAREVSFTDVGSPLSFTIVEGVRVNETNAGISIRGDVEGNSVVAAAGGFKNGMATVMETVLNIRNNATLTATAVNGTVVLATETVATSATDTATIMNPASVEVALEIDGPGDGADTRTLVSEQGGITIASDHDITITDAVFDAAGVVAIQAATALTASDTTILTPDDVMLTADTLSFAADSTAIGSMAQRAGTVTVDANGAFTVGDVTANVFETAATAGIVTGSDFTLGTIDTTAALDLDASGDVTFAGLVSGGNVDVTSTGGDILGDGDVTTTMAVTLSADDISVGDVSGDSSVSAQAATGDLTFGSLTSDGAVTATALNGDILGGGDVTTLATASLTAEAINVGGVSGDTSVTLLASTGDVTFTSLGSSGNMTATATAGDIAGGDVNAGNAAPTGAAYIAAGPNGDITLGEVNATELGESAGNPLIADNVTLGDVSTTAALTIIARDGDLTAGTLRTDGADIALTAFESGGGEGEIIIDAAYTALAGNAVTTGSIGIFAEGNVGVNLGGSGNGMNPAPLGAIDLEAGEDIFVHSEDGGVFLEDLVAGDDIVITADGGGLQGIGSFESAIVQGNNVDLRQVTFGAAPGTATSVTFTAPDTFINSNVVNNASRPFSGSVTTVNFIQNVAADPATFKDDITASGFIQITAPSLILGEDGSSVIFSAGDYIDIQATTGDMIFRGDLTLQSNTDIPTVGGLGPLFDGIRLRAAGSILPDAGFGGMLTLNAGSVGNFQPVIIEVGGDFAADVINASSLSVTDGINAWTQGDITIGSATIEQTLTLRALGGSIEVDTAEVTNLGASLTLAAGGAGSDVTSGTSITTNGGDILLSAGGDADLATVTTGGTAASIGIYSGGNTLISGGLVAGEDILVQAVGDVGAMGAPATLTAGDDIRVTATGGTIYLASAVTDGLGIDLFQVSFVNAGTEQAGLAFGAEGFAGADIVLSGVNLLGPALSGSMGEDALIVRDLTASNANLIAAAGDIRLGGTSADGASDLGGITTTSGSLLVTASGGSVSGLADGWTNLSGGSTISAPGDVSLNLTGDVEIGSVTASTVSGISADRFTIGSVIADAVSLTAAQRLQIDAGTISGSALLQTSGGTPAAFSQTNSPPVTGYGWADLSSADLVTTTASLGAAQLGTVNADGAGLAIQVTGDTVEILDATTTAVGGDLLVTANAGQLTIGTATSAGVLTATAIGGDLNVGSGTAAGNITLDALLNVDATTLTGGGNLLVTAGGDGTVGSAAVDGSITINAGGAASGGSLTGNGVALSGSAVNATTVDAGTGALTATASGADVLIGSGTAAGNITLDALLNVDATTLTGGGNLLVTAGGDATVDSAAVDGSITINAGGAASGGSLAGNDVTLSGFAVNATTVDAGSGALTGTAAGGDLFVGTGMAVGTITLTKTGDVAGEDDGITSDSLTSTGGDILLDSSTFVNIGASNAAGLLSIISPQTIVAADLTSDGSIALNTGGDAQLGDITTGVSLILLAAGDITADSLTAGEDIAALAGGGIAVGDFTAGDNVTFTAATALDLGGGSTTGGGSDDNTYVLDLALAGTSDPGAITDGPTDAVDGDILLQAPDDFALAGTISVAAADGTLTVRNLAGGSDTTSVGTTGGFEISDAELGFLAADNVVVDSGDQPLALGNINIASATGTQSLRLLSSSDIALSGVISGDGSGILQIGVGEIDANGLVDPATLSTSITATTDIASIDYASGIVDLRAVRIVFGLPDFVALADGISLEAAADLLTDAGSQLYIGDNTQKVFLQADTLRVAYSDFALFQNTAFSLGGGAILNADAANSVSDVALELFSQGDDNLDSFAIFGEINGFTGRTAGVLPNSVLNIGTLSPRELRVTQARSRVNGCVIGSPDRGCLIVDLPPPEISTIDERQAQDLISTDDPSEFLNPLVGRGNEGLILDIAQVPVGIDTMECEEDDPSCQNPETEQ